MEGIIITIVIGMIIIAIIIVIKQSLNHGRIIRNNTQDDEWPTNTYNQHYQGYTVKKYLMTKCERAYFTMINELLPKEYICLPQVPLSSIIQKNGYHKYINELFRTVDFCIFNSEYSPKLIIEINDATHNQQNRRDRDRKVNAICINAGLPISTLWTCDPNNKEKLKKEFELYLPVKHEWEKYQQ